MFRIRNFNYFFTIKVEIPEEYLSDPEMNSLYEKYMNMVEEFKAVHKEREAGRKVFLYSRNFIYFFLERVFAIFMILTFLECRNCS